MKKWQAWLMVGIGLVMVAAGGVLLWYFLGRLEKVHPQLSTLVVSVVGPDGKPVEADVYLDGVYLGKKSKLRQEIRPGTYVLRGEIPGYSGETRVTGEAGKVVETELRIAAVKPPEKLPEELAAVLKEILAGQREITQTLREFLERLVAIKPEPKEQPPKEQLPKEQVPKPRFGLAAVGGNYITGGEIRGWFPDVGFGLSIIGFAYQYDGQPMLRIGFRLLWGKGETPFYLHLGAGFAQYGDIAGWANFQIGGGVEPTILGTFYLVLEAGGVIARRAIGPAFTLGLGLWLGGE